MEAYLISLEEVIFLFVVVCIGVVSLLTLIYGIALPCLIDGRRKFWAFPLMIAGLLGLALFRMLLT